ncbi:MAG: metallophosphoesterase family protein [Chloroflexia bacterium]|nr:metallophosphoesterase family protein [Chloroflexia bacterium]
MLTVVDDRFRQREGHAVRLLCASDLHLGRRATGIPEHLGLDSALFATSVVWDRIVETALRERVDLVLLAGDVVDRENRLFEAVGSLERGLNTLSRYDIPVFAVAGDHDVDTLRRVADGDAAGSLTLLGRDGRWQGVTAERDGQPTMRLAGWSAPGQTFHGDALAGFAAVAGTEGGESPPLVAMFHGTVVDRERTAADFSPVVRAELAAQNVALWVAGHVHQPSVVVAAGVAVLEPGAACPLHADETGPHGAWIVEVVPDAPVQARLVALAPVRYQDVPIELGEASEAADVETALVRALHDALAEALADDPQGHLLCVCCRVTASGRTPLHDEMAAIVHDLARTLDIQERGVVAAIGTVVIDTRPAFDLEPLTRRPDSVGEIARLVAALESDDPDQLSGAQRELVRRTVTRLQSVHRARVFATVASDPEPDVAEARGMLRRQGWNVLQALIKQRGVE